MHYLVHLIERILQIVASRGFLRPAIPGPYSPRVSYGLERAI
jgi:hypothetical protein